MSTGRSRFPVLSLGCKQSNCVCAKGLNQCLVLEIENADQRDAVSAGLFLRHTLERDSPGINMCETKRKKHHTWNRKKKLNVSGSEEYCSNTAELPPISTQFDLPLSTFLPESVFFKWLTAGPIKCNMTEAAGNTCQASLLYYFRYLWKNLVERGFTKISHTNDLMLYSTIFSPAG